MELAQDQTKWYDVASVMMKLFKFDYNSILSAVTWKADNAYDPV
jgi:hypothetical protein